MQQIPEVGSLTLAAGKPSIKTVGEPPTMTPGQPQHKHVTESDKREDGRPSVKTVGEPCTIIPIPP